MFNLTKNEPKILTADRHNTVHTSANRRSKSLLAMLGLAALTLFSIHADAAIHNEDFTLVNWGSDWTNNRLYQNQSDYIEVKGFGQWQCYTGNGNANVYSEYGAQVRQYAFAAAHLDPNYERDCTNTPTFRYRNFNLRLLVQQWNGAGWVTEYDNTLSWAGQWLNDRRSLVHKSQSDGKRYNVYAATQIEGKPWMYGFIDFIDS